jgi:hypothetical protein
MAELNVKDQGVLTTDVNGAFPVCYHIGIDAYGHSKGPPLFTWGALPCMNVVVHNRAASRGCLAHVWNSSTDGAVLYQKAADVVQKLLTAAGDPAKADIYLFAGQAFVAGSAYQLSKKQDVDVDVFLKDRFSTHFFWNGLHQAMGQVLYWPEKNVVYFVSDAELRSLQGTMVDYGKLNMLQQMLLNVTVAKL